MIRQRVQPLIVVKSKVGFEVHSKRQATSGVKILSQQAKDSQLPERARYMGSSIACVGRVRLMKFLTRHHEIPRVSIKATSWEPEPSGALSSLKAVGVNSKAEP